jgi:hypothetical protein
MSAGSCPPSQPPPQRVRRSASRFSAPSALQSYFLLCYRAEIHSGVGHLHLNRPSDQLSRRTPPAMVSRVQRASSTRLLETSGDCLRRSNSTQISDALCKCPPLPQKHRLVREASDKGFANYL